MKKMGQCDTCIFNAGEKFNRRTGTHQVKCKAAEEMFGKEYYVENLEVSKCGRFKSIFDEPIKMPQEAKPAKKKKPTQPKAIRITKPCPTCQGEGLLTFRFDNGKRDEMDCPACYGEGEVAL